MRAFPIIPVWIMAIICILLIVLVILKAKKITYVFMIILLFMINERIMIPNGKIKTLENNVDVIFVIDKTISMNAEDYEGNNKRLDGVKKDSKEIIKELNGAKFSLITFDNDTKVIIPLTRDSLMASEALDVIEPIDELYARGTSLNKPIEDLKKILKKSYDNDRDKIRVIFYISDGEITDESKLKSYSSLKKYINYGAVLGYGTSEGGKMKYRNSFPLEGEPEEEYVEDFSNYPSYEAISKIDESNLKRIAKDLNLPYIHMTNKDELNKVLTKVKNNMSSKMSSTTKDCFDDIYYIFAIPLLLLIVIDFKRVRRDTI